MSENESIAQLVESVVEIGTEAAGPALRVLAHAAATKTRAARDERAYFAVGMLLLAASLEEYASDANLVSGLLDWIEAERSGHWLNREFGGYSLLDLSNSLRAATWKRLARIVLIDPCAGTTTGRASWCETQVAERLVGLGRSIAEAQTD